MGAKKSISTRGKIVMFIVVIVGVIYWIIGKIENWIGSLNER